MATKDKTKRCTPEDVIAALATVGASNDEYLDSKKTAAFHDEADASYWLEAQVNDSFKLKFKDNKLIVLYTVEIMTPARIGFKHESNVDSAMDQIMTYIKKKYKEITGKSVSLKQETDVMEQVIPISMRRQLRNYVCAYTIGGMDSPQAQNEKETKEMLKASLERGDELGVFRKKK